MWVGVGGGGGVETVAEMENDVPLRLLALCAVTAEQGCFLRNHLNTYMD